MAHQANIERSASSEKVNELAEQIAKREGGSKLWFVHDAWGGYWQCSTPNGPYTFRLPSNGERTNEEPETGESLNSDTSLEPASSPPGTRGIKD
jgi:hypothetical protein